MKVKIIKILIFITKKWDKMPTFFKLLSILIYMVSLVILLS